jgi:adenylate cyclase
MTLSRMAEPRPQRQLSAILAADVAGYSRLIGLDEEGTLARLKELRRTVIDPKISEYRGRIVKTMGDGLLVQFASAVDAVRCAVDIQRLMADQNTGAKEDQRIDFRMGINLGDVVIDGDDIHGDGVNVASRLEGLAEPGSICVSAGVHDQVRDKLDIAFADAGEQQLKNIARPVRAYKSRSWASSKQAAPTAHNKPTIAVLPFDNISGDPDQVYFSDGITEDIITELSRFRSLSVIARNSSFAFRNERIDISEIARRLRVQFVLEGSVRRAVNRVRITAQLINTSTGAHLWAERYDRELEDIFAVQDEVVRTVVTTVAGRLEATGAEIAKRKPPESLVAYDYVLRGLEQLNLEGDEHNSEALRLFQKAVELDPQYAVGHAYLALAIYVQWMNDRAPGELERALSFARRALELDENDSRCHRILGAIYVQMREYDRAEFHSDRSVALNPNDAFTAVYRGGLLRHIGRPQEGVAWVRKAMQQDPYHPNWYWSTLAFVLHAAGRYADALDAYSRMVQRPSFYHAYVAACHAELGQMEKAREHAVLALQAKPDFSVAARGKQLPWKNEADLQKFLDGLRKAGLPE